MSKSYIDFKDIYDSGKLSTELMKELKTVESMLNLTPTVKDNKSKQWVASPTNVAVMSYTDVTVRKVSSMVEQGLSYASGDYYIFVQFGGKPSVTKSPNGIIKAMNKLASKHGYIANINTGCVYKNFEHFKVKRNGLVDTIELVNSSDHEIGVGVQNDILAPYAVVTLYDKKTSTVISSKVTVIRNGEYEAAKKQGSYTHKTYPVPMAEKVALKRAGDQMAASLGIDDSVELEALKREIADHNADYDMSKDISSEAETDEVKFISDEQNDKLEKMIVDYGVNRMAFIGWLSKEKYSKSIVKLPAKYYDDVMAKLEQRKPKES